MRTKYGEEFKCVYSWQNYATSYVDPGPFGKISQYHIYVYPVKNPGLKFICRVDRDREPYQDEYIASRLGDELSSKVRAHLQDKAGDCLIEVTVGEDDILEEYYIPKTGNNITFEQIREIKNNAPETPSPVTLVYIIARANEISDFRALVDRLCGLTADNSLGDMVRVAFTALTDEEFSGMPSDAQIRPRFVSYYITAPIKKDGIEFFTSTEDSMNKSKDSELKKADAVKKFNEKFAAEKGE